MTDIGSILVRAVSGNHAGTARGNFDRETLPRGGGPERLVRSPVGVRARAARRRREQEREQREPGRGPWTAPAGLDLPPPDDRHAPPKPRQKPRTAGITAAPHPAPGPGGTEANRGTHGGGDGWDPRLLQEPRRTAEAQIQPGTPREARPGTARARPMHLPTEPPTRSPEGSPGHFAARQRTGFVSGSRCINEPVNRILQGESGGVSPTLGSRGPGPGREVGPGDEKLRRTTFILQEGESGFVEALCAPVFFKKMG